MRDGGVVKGIPSTGSRKTCMMKAVLIGITTFCLSAYADTINLEFGVINVAGSTKQWFDSDGTLCIEVSDPYPVKVTIDPKKEYFYDEKKYEWSVDPREFYFTGSTKVYCTATLFEDGVSEDSRRVLFVPWMKIDVSNVVLHSPNPEKGWPYDPVYDDPIWKITVRGSLSEAAAGNDDKAPVSYVLNKPATSVEIVPYKSTWHGKVTAGAGSFMGTPTTNAGKNKVDAWIISNQDEDDGYFVEVTARGDRSDVDTDQSQKVGIKREKYYTSTANEHPEKVPVSLVAEITSDGDLGLKVAGTYFTLAGLIPHPAVGIPATLASLALTWCPPQSATWKDDNFMMVMNGPWEMSMHLWEETKYVVKSETTSRLTAQTEKGTFSVCFERIYRLGWLSYMVEQGKLPPVDGLGTSPVVGEETMNGALDPKQLDDGFVSDYQQTTGVLPGTGNGLPVTIGSESFGPTIKANFFFERKLLPPDLANEWPPAQPSTSN